MKTAELQTEIMPQPIGAQKIRTLKIQPLIRVTRWNDTTVPEIRLSGAWLEKLGFCHGGRVEVRTSEGRLVITPITA